MASSSADAGPSDRTTTGVYQRASWCSLFYRSRLTGCLVERVSTLGYATLDRFLELLPTGSNLKKSLKDLEAKAQVAESTCDWEGAEEVYLNCSMVLLTHSVSGGDITTAAVIALTIWAGLRMANLAHLKLKNHQRSIQHLLTIMGVCKNLVAARTRSVHFSFPDRNSDPPVVGYEEPYPPEWEMGLMWQKLVVLFDWKCTLADGREPNLSGEQLSYEAAAASIPHLRFPGVHVDTVEMNLCGSLALMFNSDGQFERALDWIKRKRLSLDSRLEHFSGRARRSDATPEDKKVFEVEKVDCFYDDARTVLDEAAILSHLENFTESRDCLLRFKPFLEEEDTSPMSDEHRNIYLVLVNSELLRLSSFISNEHVSQVVKSINADLKDLIEEMVPSGTSDGLAEGLIFLQGSEQLIAEKEYEKALARLQSWRNILKDGHSSRSYQLDVYRCSTLLAGCEEAILEGEAGEVGRYSGTCRQWRWRSLERLERACIYYDEVFAVAIEKYHNNNSAISASLLARALFSLVVMSPDCKFLYDKSKLPFLRKWLKDHYGVADHVTTLYGCPEHECGYSGTLNIWSHCPHNPGWLYVVQVLYKYSSRVGAENVYKASSLAAGKWSKVISYDIVAITALQGVCQLMQFNIESMLGIESMSGMRNDAERTIIIRPWGLMALPMRFYLMREQLIWAERGRARSLAYQRGPGSLDAELARSLLDFDIDDNVAWNAVEDSQKACGEGTVFVEYSCPAMEAVPLHSKVISADVWAYVVTQGGAVESFKLSKDILDPRFGLLIASALHTAMSSKVEYDKVMSMPHTDDGTDMMSHYLERMYEVLISPFEHLLPKERHHKLVFAPAQILSAVPFALLRDPKTKEYLFLRHTISITPSLRVLGICNERLSILKSCALMEEGKSALVIGNAIYERHRLLAGSAKEVDAIVELFGKDKVFSLQGSAATVGAVTNLVNDLSQSAYVQGFIHFAVHGHWDADNFVQGALELSHESVGSSAPGPSSSHEGRTGTAANGHYLHSSAIVKSDWRAHMVILSACNTALGKGTTEGVMNLPRAFMAAGVPCTVMSHWEVNDSSTATLMENFYSHLVKKDTDVASALRSAMMQCLEDGLEIYKWGPFAVWGLPTVCLPEGMQTGTI